MKIKWIVALVLCPVWLAAGRWALAIPRPDHVVIVIEENHSFSNVIGSANAPYMNSLAASGASFNNMYGITHPSQGNYIQFFSGENQGVLNDTVPAAGAPFSTPNLAAALLAAGKTFGGYSEDLPSIGSTVNSAPDVNGKAGYVRRHNPWVNWQVNSPATNQLPPSVNMPFTSFPSDYSQLPDVSIVVPNLQNDMHDGTIAQADTWLQNNLGAYANWAQTHNSLLIVTWDEDSFASRNHIPTIFSGQMVAQTTNNSTWTLHNIARTVGDMFGVAPSGSMTAVSPITGVFKSDPATVIRSFQQGVSGYGGAKDTFIESGAAGTAHSGDTIISVDGSPQTQGLIRFDDIIGTGASQVPQGLQVLSAKLIILTGNSSANGDNSSSTMSLHPMLTTWSDNATWTSLGAGVSANGTEASTASEFHIVPNSRDTFAVFDVTASLRSWVLDPTKNYGWLIQPSGTDGWNFDSSEFATLNLRPMLEVTFMVAFSGDTNGDQVVDFTDLNTLLSHYGQTGNSSAGDFNDSGTITFEDLNLLLTNYGLHAPQSSAAVPIPEPGALALGMLGACGLLVAARRKRAAMR